MQIFEGRCASEGHSYAAVGPSGMDRRAGALQRCITKTGVAIAVVGSGPPWPKNGRVPESGARVERAVKWARG